MTFSAPEDSPLKVLPPLFGLSLRRRLFAADGAGMCWTFDALACWLARRVRLGSPEGRAGGQLSPERSIDNSMTAQKQLQGSMNRLNDSPTVPPSHRPQNTGCPPWWRGTGRRAQPAAATTLPAGPAPVRPVSAQLELWTALGWISRGSSAPGLIWIGAGIPITSEYRSSPIV